MVVQIREFDITESESEVNEWLSKTENFKKILGIRYAAGYNAFKESDFSKCSVVYSK